MVDLSNRKIAVLLGGVMRVRFWVERHWAVPEEGMEREPMFGITAAVENELIGKCGERQIKRMWETRIENKGIYASVRIAVKRLEGCWFGLAWWFAMAHSQEKSIEVRISEKKKFLQAGWRLQQ